MLCLATGTGRTLVVKGADKVVMKYKNPGDIEEAHEQSEDFTVIPTYRDRSFKLLKPPALYVTSDLRMIYFCPLPNEPQDEGKTWLSVKLVPKETFFWSIEHADDGGMIYADKLSKRAAAALLEFETSSVLSSPFD